MQNIHSREGYRPAAMANKLTGRLTKQWWWEVPKGHYTVSDPRTQIYDHKETPRTKKNYIRVTKAKWYHGKLRSLIKMGLLNLWFYHTSEKNVAETKQTDVYYYILTLTGDCMGKEMMVCNNQSQQLSNFCHFMISKLGPICVGPF